MEYPKQHFISYLSASWMLDGDDDKEEERSEKKGEQ